MNNCLSVVLSFTLPRHRKTEPTLLWWTKVVVSMILLSGLIVYIYVLIDLIIRDEPSIQYTTVDLDSQQLLPVLNIEVASNAIIYCDFMNDETDDLGNCSTNLELVAYESYRNYKFTPTNNSYSWLFLTWNNTSGNTFSNITFGGELDDIKDKYPDQTNLQKYITYLQTNNILYIREKKRNAIYIKWTRREYLIRDWTNYLGFPNRHVSLRIPQAMAETPSTSYYENQTTVAISPYGDANGHFETVETEKRSETVLGNIGPLGGAISLLLGIYTILFGGSLLSPWGIFQTYCCKYKTRSKRKLLKNLSVIPLTEKNQLHFEKSKDPDLITLRFNSLEIVLK
ncbi:7611_t:CDS:2, partial [Entrophospora sp. SA101]